MGKLEPLHPVGGNVKWCSHHGEQYGDSSKNTELIYDPAILLLGTYPEELHPVGGNVKWYSHYGDSSKNTELIYDPAIRLLGTYPKELKARS